MNKQTEALKLAEDALKRVRTQDMELVQLSMIALAAIREALAEQPAQPQQEPEIVQRVKRRTGKTIRTARNPNITARECIELADWIAANTSPPAQRTWVGLTPEQRQAIAEANNTLVDDDLFDAIESLLKEKNT